MIDWILAATGADEVLDPIRHAPFMIAAYVVVWAGILAYATVLLVRLKGAKPT